jgi:urea transport system ATP-binding protein
LEIGMVLAARPRLLLLDEPTAGMTAFETAATVDLIRSMAGQNGATILVIEHDTGFLERLNCQITVMAKGKVLATGTYQEIHDDPEVRALYFGNSPDA